MADKVTGVDVGTNAVRAVSATLGDRPRITHFGQLGLPAGAVSEGEVVDVPAVAAQLRALWKQADFTSKSVRVGIASARVILRIVEMPVMSDADTRSALQFQLGEYVPLAPEATVFDFQPLRGAVGGDRQVRPLLLAAAPRDAVQPLIDAVRQAGLKVAGVDVVAAALARAVAPPPDPAGGSAVEAVVSIGASTIVVVVARGGEPLFSRTVTNISGRHVTDRIASALSVPRQDAEQFKRHLPADAPTDLAARLHVATDPSIAEICAEIGDSLDYYASQPDHPPIEAVAITGGCSLLEGLTERLEERVRVPVRMADPLVRFDRRIPGFEDEDLPFVMPFMAAAVGIALGATQGKAKRINLLPDNGRALTRSSRPLLLGGLAVAAVVGGGFLVLRQGSELDEVRAARSELEQALVPARLEAAQRAATSQSTASSDPAAAILRLARQGDIDWSTVAAQLDASGEPMGVTVTGITGTAAVPVVAANTTAPAQDAATTSGSSADSAAGSAAGSAAEPTPAAEATTSVPAPVPSPTVTPVGGPGTVAVSATAADLETVAAWIDAVTANPHFASAWVDAITEVATDDGGSEIQFTASVTVTDLNLVARNLPEGSPS